MPAKATQPCPLLIWSVRQTMLKSKEMIEISGELPYICKDRIASACKDHGLVYLEHIANWVSRVLSNKQTGFTLE